MAQLIGFTGMPHVPGFQFWAVRRPGLLQSTQPNVWPTYKSWPGAAHAGISIGRGLPPFRAVTVAPNDADQLWGEAVTITRGTGTPQTFEFVEPGQPVTIPGAIAVEVASGAVAADCAEALRAAIQTTWAQITDPTPLAFVPTINLYGPATVGIVTPSAALFPSLVVTTSSDVLLGTSTFGGAPWAQYGQPLLHRAWKAFVMPGVDPAGATEFDWTSLAALNVTMGILPVRAKPVWCQVMPDFGPALTKLEEPPA